MHVFFYLFIQLQANQSVVSAHFLPLDNATLTMSRTIDHVQRVKRIKMMRIVQPTFAMQPQRLIAFIVMSGEKYNRKWFSCFGPTARISLSTQHLHLLIYCLIILFVVALPSTRNHKMSTQNKSEGRKSKTPSQSEPKRDAVDSTREYFQV